MVGKHVPKFPTKNYCKQTTSIMAIVTSDLGLNLEFREMT